jgi:tRNA(Ile)-lysidine synthase
MQELFSNDFKESVQVIIYLIMLERVILALRYAGPMDANRPILAGVSGGPDSLALMHMLQQLGCSLVIAHLDHCLRPESAAEADAVRQAAQAAGLPYVVGKEDVLHLAQQQSLSIEEAARNARYQFLFSQAELHGAQAVGVGHTADDQVETVLMHFLRGTGMSGLSGMAYRSLPNPWSQQIPLVRPLLGVWRAEIMQYLAQRGLRPNLDASNQDVRFYRNRMRLETLPYLESLNPGVRQRIWQMADVLSQEDEIVEGVVGAAWDECCLASSTSFVTLDIPRLRRQSPGVQRRVLRRGIALLRPGLRDIDFATIDRALRFLQSPPATRQIDLAAGLRLSIEDEKLWIAAWGTNLPAASWPQIDPTFKAQVEVPGEIPLPDGWLLRTETLPATPALYAQATANPDPFRAWLDMGQLDLPLALRTRRPGDRLRPFGLGGHSQKLSDFMVNAKLPRRARDGWPLLIAGGQIAWVPGYAIAADYAIHENTPRVFFVILLRPGKQEIHT